jgi:hypothetical protein
MRRIKMSRVYLHQKTDTDAFHKAVEVCSPDQVPVRADQTHEAWLSLGEVRARSSWPFHAFALVDWEFDETSDNIRLVTPPETKILLLAKKDIDFRLSGNLTYIVGKSHVQEYIARARSFMQARAAASSQLPINFSE